MELYSLLKRLQPLSPSLLLSPSSPYVFMEIIFLKVGACAVIMRPGATATSGLSAAVTLDWNGKAFDY